MPRTPHGLAQDLTCAATLRTAAESSKTGSTRQRLSNTSARPPSAPAASNAGHATPASSSGTPPRANEAKLDMSCADTSRTPPRSAAAPLKRSSSQWRPAEPNSRGSSEPWAAPSAPPL